MAEKKRNPIGAPLSKKIPKRPLDITSAGDANAPPDKTFALYAMDVGLDVEDFRDVVLQLGRDIFEGKSAPLIVTVPDYDTDPRELWDIPEVIDVCKRAVESGFISLLKLNLPGTAARRPEIFGAFDVWLIGQGCGYAGEAVDEALLRRFHEALVVSNAVAEGVLAGTVGEA